MLLICGYLVKHVPDINYGLVIGWKMCRWWMAGNHLFLIVVSLKSVFSLVSGYQRVPVCWGFFGPWRASPLFWILEGFSTYFLRWLGQFGILPWLVLWTPHLFSPSSTQEFDITLLQNVSSWNYWFCLWLLCVFPRFFVSLWLLRFSCAVLPKFCSWKIAFFSFGGWNCTNPFFSYRFINPW